MNVQILCSSSLQLGASETPTKGKVRPFQLAIKYSNQD